mgnify:CR=1 FL=1
MRIIDLHCYPGTQEWVTCQGPYVEALAKYWNRGWVAKTEAEVIRDFSDAGVEAVLVALDLETTIATPPCSNEYVHGMWKRHSARVIQAWGAVEPARGDAAIAQANGQPGPDGLRLLQVGTDHDVLRRGVVVGDTARSSIPLRMSEKNSRGFRWTWENAPW